QGFAAHGTERLSECDHVPGPALGTGGCQRSDRIIAHDPLADRNLGGPGQRLDTALKRRERQSELLLDLPRGQGTRSAARQRYLPGEWEARKIEDLQILDE